MFDYLGSSVRAGSRSSHFHHVRNFVHSEEEKYRSRYGTDNQGSGGTLSNEGKIDLEFVNKLN